MPDLLNAQERPFAGAGPNTPALVGFGGESLPYVATGTTYAGQAFAATIPASQATTAFTPTTTVTIANAIYLPKQQPVYQLGVSVIAQGTNTGFWMALLDQARNVLAVSANGLTPTANTVNYYSVLPANAIPYYTAYAGIYYVATGIVTSAAGTLGAAAAVQAGIYTGPPVLNGTLATAATTTPPAVGANLGAITVTTTGLCYALVA
jgi:hypothetical protein